MVRRSVSQLVNRVAGVSFPSARQPDRLSNLELGSIEDFAGGRHPLSIPAVRRVVHASIDQTRLSLVGTMSARRGFISCFAHDASRDRDLHSCFMMTGRDALNRLREGNRRFVARQSAGSNLSIPAPAADLVTGQEPFAIILGCSDSRVPAELVF